MLKRFLPLVLVVMGLGVLSANQTGPDALSFISADVGRVTTSAPGDRIPVPATTAAGGDTVAAETMATPPTTMSAPSPTTAPPVTAPTTTAPTGTVLSAPSTASAHPPGVLLIGDSVLEGLNILGYSFGPNTSYGTEVSRSALKLEEALAEHEPPANLVVHLGTNGWWPDLGAEYDRILGALTDRRVLLVTISVDRPYAAQANGELAAVASAHDHITLVDWAAATSPDILRSDGFHPNLDGYEVLARLIADALGLPPELQLAPPTTLEP